MPRPKKLDPGQPNKYRSRDIIFARRERREEERREAEQARLERERQWRLKTPAQRAEVDDVILELNQWGVVRAFFAASANFGHYASTVNILRRLQELGYTGSFDIIIDERANADGAGGKVARLVADHAQNLFFGQQAIYRTLSPGGLVGGLPLAQAQFGITGGIDDERDISAQQLAVHNLIKLQPYRWDRGPYAIDTANGAVDLTRKYGASHFKLRTFYRADPLESDVADDGVPVTEIAKYLCREAQRGTLHLCPTYGLHTWSNPIEVLSNFTLGVLSAQSAGPPPEVGPFIMSQHHWEQTHASRKRKAVIVVLGDWAKKNAQLGFAHGSSMQLFGEFITKQFAYSSSFLTAPNEAFKSFCKAVGTDTRVRTLSCMAADRDKADLRVVQKAVDDLAEGCVLVVQLGEVGIPLFNWLYANATLPAIFEGQSTAELALNLGRPYLHLKHGNHYPIWPLGSDAVDEFHTRLRTVISSLEAQHRYWSVDMRSKKNPAEEISAFILDCLDTSASNQVGQYFKQIRSTFHNEVTGKLESALRIYKKEKDVGQAWKDTVTPSTFAHITSKVP